MIDFVLLLLFVALQGVLGWPANRGALTVLLVLLLLMWRALIISLRCPDIFGTLLGTGIVGMIGIQAVINLGGVTGLIPITGVTLPFISYGGSSLLVTLVSMGILLSISRYSSA